MKVRLKGIKLTQISTDFPGILDPKQFTGYDIQGPEGQGLLLVLSLMYLCGNSKSGYISVLLSDLSCLLHKAHYYTDVTAIALQVKMNYIRCCLLKTWYMELWECYITILMLFTRQDFVFSYHDKCLLTWIHGRQPLSRWLEIGGLAFFHTVLKHIFRLEVFLYPSLSLLPHSLSLHLHEEFYRVLITEEVFPQDNIAYFHCILLIFLLFF